MSIASEITRIKNNISAAYAACSEKDAALPQTQNSGNLADTIAGISTGADTPTYEYAQVNPVAAAYLSEVTYDSSDYTDSRIADYADRSTPYRKDRPSGKSVTVPAAGTMTQTDGDKCLSQNVTTGERSVCNITPGSKGAYLIRNTSDKIIAAGSLKPTGALRMIDAGGETFNIRDLGGWTCDGGRLKYGLIFRGCELSGDNYHVDITADQKRFFADYLGIRDEIDLRGNSEVDGDDEIYGTADDITSSAIGDQVDYIRRPIAPYALGVNLSDMTQTGYYATLIKRVIADVAAEKPCYIHCMVGADRTGTLCALIEAVCGVSPGDIDKDYELTSFARNNIRRRSDSSWVGFIERINTFSGTTLRDKVVDYMLQAGVGIDEINALRSALIDGDPQPLTSPYTDVTVTKTLTHTTADNTDASAAKYQRYQTSLTPESGYVISDVRITMDGTDITAGVFKGTEVALLRRVVRTLTDCTIDNTKSAVTDGESYAATLTPNTGFTLEGATVTIMMGGTNVSTYYKDGVIAIPRVTGDLVITATAVPQAAQNLFDPTAATDSARINSSGNAVATSAGQLVTDFIPVTGSDSILLISDKAQTANSYTGMIALYSASKAYIGVAYYAGPAWTHNSDNTGGVADLSVIQNAFQAAFCRLCIAYTDQGSIEIYRQS